MSGMHLGQVAPRGQVADAHRVELRALVVDGVGQQPVVGAVGGGAELPIGLALGLLVAVEQNLLGAAAARAPAQAHILAAGDVAGVVLETAVGRGNRRIVLLDARLHLGEQLVLQRPWCPPGRPRRRRSRPPDRRGSSASSAPGSRMTSCQFVGPQPGVLVDELDPVVDRERRAPLGHGGRRADEGAVETVHVGAFLAEQTLRMSASADQRPRSGILAEGGTLAKRAVRDFRGESSSLDEAPASRGQPSSGLELERRAVDAVAQAGRLARAVGKDVAKVAVAAGAAHLGAPHEEGEVLVLAYGCLGRPVGRSSASPCRTRIWRRTRRASAPQPAH